MPTNHRFHSIDVLRAITMLLMIFVNDVSGVSGLPDWLGHAHAEEDRLGFSDVIFPAFLFIVGLSLPLAIAARKRKGDSNVNLVIYILTRSVALIIMGFFHVNMEVYSEQALLPYPVFLILATIAFFLIWLDYPKSWPRGKRLALQIPGITLLIVLAIIYKGGENGEIGGMKPYWWGILGIIGWSYLVAALIFLLAKESLPGVLIATAIALLINIGSHGGLLHFEVPIIGDASSLSLVLLGISSTLCYLQARERSRTGRFRIIASLAGAIMIIAGFLLRPHTGGISKIFSTPAWVLICAGITLIAFCAIEWLTDQQHKENWFSLIRPAGTSTLTAYLLPYLQIGLMILLGISYPSWFNEGAGGLLRSAITAFAIVLITGVLEKRRIRLKV